MDKFILQSVDEHSERLFQSDHMRGWVDSMLRTLPPAVESLDYIEGYRAGIRHRLKDAQDTLARIPRIEICTEAR